VTSWGTQTYLEAFDSVSAFLPTAPDVSLDDGTTRQAMWSDAYVRWSVAGSSHNAIRGSAVTVLAVRPVGKPFDPNDLEYC
jgi:hypothetical protein